MGAPLDQQKLLADMQEIEKHMRRHDLKGLSSELGPQAPPPDVFVKREDYPLGDEARPAKSRRPLVLGAAVVGMLCATAFGARFANLGEAPSKLDIAESEALAALHTTPKAPEPAPAAPEPQVEASIAPSSPAAEPVQAAAPEEAAPTPVEAKTPTTLPMAAGPSIATLGAAPVPPSALTPSEPAPEPQPPVAHPAHAKTPTAKEPAKPAAPKPVATKPAPPTKVAALPPHPPAAKPEHAQAPAKPATPKTARKPAATQATAAARPAAEATGERPAPAAPQQEEGLLQKAQHTLGSVTGSVTGAVRNLVGGN